MVAIEKGFELERSKGALDTRLDIVAPQVVPRPGRSGSTSRARADFFAGASLRRLSCLNSLEDAARPAPDVAAGAGVAGGGASAAGAPSSALGASGADASGVASPLGKALGSPPGAGGG